MMYNRFEEGIHPREPLLNALTVLKDHSSSLEDHFHLLEKVFFWRNQLTRDFEKCIQHPFSRQRITILKEAYKQHALFSVPGSVANGFSSHSPHGSFSSAGSTSDLSSAAVITDSVALDWKPVRDIAFCICSTPFSQFSMKVSLLFRRKTDGKWR
jgi:hypothetical protein